MTAGDSDGIAPLLRGGGPWRGRSSRAARSAKGQQEGLGTSYLGNGLNGIAAALMAYEFLVFFASMGSYARPGLVLVAWFLLAASFATVVITIRTSGDRLPTLAYAAFLLGIAGAVVLDLIAVVEPGSAAVAPTAAVAAAVAHAAMIVHRRSIEILAVALVVGVAELVTFGAMSPGDPTSFSVRVSALVVTIAPAVVVVVMMRGFRRMVQHEIDRALVQSTTLGPRYAVGMLASEELARLDLAAERLLTEVGDGSTPLPLDAHRAALAASLATQLRLHLIEGRRETWLHHAILESELLAPLVELHDPDGAAGLLGHQQRDGLLSAIWLILDGSTAVLHVEAGPPRDPGADAPPRTLLVPLVLRSEGVPLRGVDPATWEAIAQVGTFREPPRDGELVIEIDCLVENPADR
ncbi:hypothetical protein GSU68_11890 [Rathayibacter sp. VKM Ac-2759]|uniref:hypothetical protein n=1 Tax=Rathayibacter sp. VKM Ac-2759 TaxID=2609252 RepID=UPI001316981F|nr:hypothetical protein [Rathayibacter sp. VKM Ac-2759]QHC67192.1 hypothetical protein GSU68_11890 [Rathayibacter sp. VKM Ac-2759]